ncbi:MAG: hypothetical protein F6K24_18655 [Okeania sp. SIO2D1]|nr:hypothetical protein [Okeania sp. SIO2D1]
MAAQNNWEKQILEEISNIHKATIIAGSVGSGEIFEQANIDAYQFTPNRGLDQNQRYYLIGPEWSIIQQSSLLKAGHDMLGDRLGFTIDFEEWFEDFEYEFQKNLPSTKKPATSKLKPWGKEVANRPKKLNLLTKEQAREKGYMKIRFWKDRTVEKDSEVLAGTYTELRQQLLDRMKQQSVDVQVYGIPTTAYQQEVKFVPQVILFFVEDVEDVEPGWEPVYGRFSFRVNGETYNTINQARALQLATKINQQFGEGVGYVWRKGKTTISYTDKENGYRMWLNCRSQADGESLIKRALAIQGVSFAKSKMGVRENADASNAYPTIPPTETIYGKQKRLPRRKPIANVRFVRSELHIWGRPEPVVLIDKVNYRANALISA